MKKKMKKAVYKFIKCEGITATIAAMVILIVFIKAALIESNSAFLFRLCVTQTAAGRLCVWTINILSRLFFR